MPTLPAHPNLDQLRHQAKDLLRSAKTGDSDALGQIQAVSEQLTLASAQLAVALAYGFASWPKLKAEVEARTSGARTRTTRRRAPPCASVGCDGGRRQPSGRAVSAPFVQSSLCERGANISPSTRIYSRVTGPRQIPLSCGAFMAAATRSCVAVENATLH
jgi:hypothetical protein